MAEPITFKLSRWDCLTLLRALVEDDRRLRRIMGATTEKSSYAMERADIARAALILIKELRKSPGDLDPAYLLELQKYFDPKTKVKEGKGGKSKK